MYAYDLTAATGQKLANVNRCGVRGSGLEEHFEKSNQQAAFANRRHFHFIGFRYWLRDHPRAWGSRLAATLAEWIHRHIQQRDARVQKADG